MDVLGALSRQKIHDVSGRGGFAGKREELWDLVWNEPSKTNLLYIDIYIYIVIFICTHNMDLIWDSWLLDVVGMIYHRTGRTPRFELSIHCLTAKEHALLDEARLKGDVWRTLWRRQDFT